MASSSRRSFIKKSAIAAAGLGIWGSLNREVFASSNKVSASDKITLGLIGCRNMGFQILEKHLAYPNVQCIAMCDVDENVLNEKAYELEKKYSQKPRHYKDFRKLIENKDIDAVIIGTPDHWHCLPYVYACQESKDIYIEKPMANSIEECNIMVKAAKKYNRVVQVGQQQRSGKNWQNIMSKIKSGDLGKLRKIEIWANFNYGIGGKKVPDSPVPKGVDYDFWQGPAPERKTFNASRFHRYWRMFWDYGGGLMTDWGVHLIDMALWAGDVTAAPKTVLAYGKNLSYENYDHETYDTMSVIYPLDEYIITWEHTAGTQNGPYDKSYGLRFVCDLGSILANRDGYKIIPERDDDKKVFKIDEYEYDIPHLNHDLHSRNFLDCIKSRDKTNCTPEIGRQAALYTHMANIAARTGDYKLEWDEENNRFTNSEKANQYIVPYYRKPWELPKI